MDSQQVRDVFLEALAETSATDDGGLFAHIVCQLTGAIDITESELGEVRIDATALVEGARESSNFLKRCAAHLVQSIVCVDQRSSTESEVRHGFPESFARAT
jgi:hypothetical protein